MKTASQSTRKAFALRMAEYGEINKDFSVFEADIGKSTYSYLFGEKYPDRYFNMGIAEANAVGAAAGMAASGRTTVVCSYGVFISMRALETIRTFVCYPNLDVKFFSSHGGLTAAIDGVTHQATEDIALMTTLPNMRVIVPADTVASTGLFDSMMNIQGPVYARLMREPLYEIYEPGEAFPLGGSKLLRSGKDITIVTYGDMVAQTLLARDLLAKSGIEAEVIDAYSIKPLDLLNILPSVRKTNACLVVEDHQRRNGLGYEMASNLIGLGEIVFDILGLQDTFGETGSYDKLLNKYGLSSECILEKATLMVEHKKSRRL